MLWSLEKTLTGVAARSPRLRTPLGSPASKSCRSVTAVCIGQLCRSQSFHTWQFAQSGLIAYENEGQYNTTATRMQNRPSTANPRSCRYLISSLELGRVLAACNIGNDPGEKIVCHKPPEIFLLHLRNCHSGESAKTTRMPGPTLAFKQFPSDALPACIRSTSQRLNSDI